MHVTSTSATITGLNNGQIYSLTVSAHNSVNSGPQTLAVSATPESPVTVPASRPGRPRSRGTASFRSAGWPLPPTGERRLTTTRSTLTASSNQSTMRPPLPQLPAWSTAFHTILPWQRTTPWGRGAQSSTGTATPSPDKTVPGVPTGITVTPGDAEITLSWTVPSSNGGDTIDFYLIYVDGVIGSDHCTALSQTFTGLVNGQRV